MGNLTYLGSVRLDFESDTIEQAEGQKQLWNSNTDIVKEDEGSVDASDGIVADARLDGGHSGVESIGHGGGDRK